MIIAGEVYKSKVALRSVCVTFSLFFLLLHEMTVILPAPMAVNLTNLEKFEQSLAAQNTPTPVLPDDFRFAQFLDVKEDGTHTMTIVQLNEPSFLPYLGRFKNMTGHNVINSGVTKYSQVLCRGSLQTLCTTTFTAVNKPIKQGAVQPKLFSPNGVFNNVEMFIYIRSDLSDQAQVQQALEEAKRPVQIERMTRITGALAPFDPRIYLTKIACNINIDLPDPIFVYHLYLIQFVQPKTYT